MAAESKVADQFALQRKVAVAGAILLTCTTVLDVARRWSKKSQKGQQLPSPPGSWPIFGHLLTCMGYCWDNTSLALARWGLDLQRTHGLKAYRANLLGSEIVCISDPDLVQQVFEGDPHRFTKDFANAPLGGDLLEYSFKDGLFTAATDDPKWQVAHRVLISPFSVRGVRGIMPLMCEQADQLIKAMKRDVGYGNSTYIDTWVTKMAFETIAVCGLGTSFGCFEDDKTHPFVTSLNQVVESLDPLGRWPSFLRPIFCRKLLKNYIESAGSLRQTCLDILHRRKSEEQADQKKDLLDRMILDADPKTGKYMSEESIVDNLLTFLFAGQDSTAAAMASCLCYLCSNPECKEQLLREIDEVVGDDAVTYEHLNELQYLDWCIKETLRLMPPASGALRESTSEQLLGQWHIPAKVPVVVNTMALHYSAELWGNDVDEFKPGRWEHGLPHKFAFMPFSHGPRACIGREFTLLEQKITLVKLFQNFDIEQVPCKEMPGYSPVKADGVHPPFLKFDAQVKRDSAFLGLYTNFKLLPRTHAQ
mmetsp:Transcript_96559/g.133892  ORF Transcript_96559/g.133892 Transcript_96559/m.133892 type:complete len:534 (-) Transcript_96559:113-1714(-)